jgi:hypothetical protein
MNFALAALAMQAGFDVRPALVADRRNALFNPKVMADRYFLNDLAVAVMVGKSWTVIDTSDSLLSPGLLPWQEQGMYALLGDPKTPSFIQTLPSSPDISTEFRTAHLNLSTQGTLEGDVDESYTGHRAEEYRRQIGNKSVAQREEWFRDRLIRMFPEADVTLKLEDVDDSSKPLLVHYHLRAPHYAEVAGKRLLFQPIAFRRAQAYPQFAATERRFAVEFSTAWKEVDQIHIQLPEGYVLDNADSPGSVNFGRLGSYEITMTVTNGSNPELYTSRELTFGREGQLYFLPSEYPSLKNIFGAIAARDRHTLSLKGN